MKGRTVQVFLRTPLYRGRFPAVGERHPLSRDVVEIVGEVIEERSAGLHLRVIELRDELGDALSPSPFGEIVLPTAKIDYTVPTEPEGT